ncbi:MAG: DUF4390 domain-containing protein [Acidiferrobacterales bacterium]
MAVLLIFVASGMARVALADFNVREVRTQLSTDSLGFSAQLDLNLSKKAEEALNTGIPLDVVIDIALLQHRSILWDRTIATWDLRRTLQFHALSGQYIVGGAGISADSYDNFASLDNALGYLGEIDELRLPLYDKDMPASGGEYHVRLRVYLDINSLPSPLRPVAYTSPAWHLSSGWTTWAVQR